MLTVPSGLSRNPAPHPSRSRPGAWPEAAARSKTPFAKWCSLWFAPGSTKTCSPWSSGWSGRRSPAGRAAPTRRKPPPLNAHTRDRSHIAEWPDAVPVFAAGTLEENGSVMLDKTYRPETVETRLYEAWEKSGAFAADPEGGKRPYTI